MKRMKVKLALLMAFFVVAGVLALPVDRTKAAGISLIYDGLNYGAVFDPVYYANKYPDVKRAYGNNQKAAFDHFLLCGMKEGRQGKASFNVFAYLNRYKDLRDLYGCNLTEYYKHYMLYGWLQGRNPKPYKGDDLRNKRINYVLISRVYNGVDYSAVFNPVHYFDKYYDVRMAYNFDQQAAFDHFILCGMKEGRQGKKTVAKNQIKAVKTGEALYKISIFNPSCTEGKITDIYMPTWSTENGTDDMSWYHAVKDANGIWTAEINGWTHNSTGEYNTMVYGVVNGKNVYLGKITYVNAFELPVRHGWYKLGDNYFFYDRTTGELQKGGESCGISLNSDGSAVMTAYASEKLPVMVRAREIVEEICIPWESLESKMDKCYRYVIKYPYLMKDYMVGDHINSWACLDAHYANNILNAYGNQNTLGGECTAEAAALAYLYAELNFGEVYLYTSTVHGWIYAGGRYYDPNCAAKNGTDKWMNQPDYIAPPTYTFKIN
ncbi:MAG: GBS Bsp-like repeat-containing protein [Lachnospiraceae bacterium]|nr:GBS Bsp-like repeat-containing protein [Lachnospiraceae bacterium]